MKIAFIASEIVPFASTGGLGDVARALPLALAEKGHQVWRFMPFYRKAAIHAPNAVFTGLRLPVPMDGKQKEAEIWRLDEHRLTTFFIRHDEFFDREELYGLAHRAYDDNFARFVFFQKAVVALIDELKLNPELVHCNDWQTGMVPMFLKYGIDGKGRAGQEKTLITIHNLAYQGVFPSEEFTITNLDPAKCFTIDSAEYYGKINCLKAGIVSADRINTVSPSYAKEIQTPEHGCGLEDVLRYRNDRLNGILNGIDYTLWDPATDPHLPENFDIETVSKKQTCKKKILHKGKLGRSLKAPLLTMISRLTEQKGLDLLADAMPEIMKLDVRFFLLGNGQHEYEELCRSWMNEYPGKFHAEIGFIPELSHQLEAGADIFLMPSRFEPCGLNQMYSQRYGTAPLVHAVGGLNDTVADYEDTPGQSTGFKFREYTKEALVNCVKRAVSLYGTEAWEPLMQRMMSQDRSMLHMAGEYEQLYEKLKIQ